MTRFVRLLVLSSRVKGVGLSPVAQMLRDLSVRPGPGMFRQLALLNNRFEVYIVIRVILEGPQIKCSRSRHIYDGHGSSVRARGSILRDPG